jgi:hypothetical protein
MTEAGGRAIAIRWMAIGDPRKEEDTGWAEQFLAAFYRVIGER